MLRVEKLNYEIKGRKLLRDISFQIRKGEVLAILGANGAGKSTLLKLLCGEHRPTTGIISLYGNALDSYDTRDLARSRAMLSQQQQVSLAFKVDEIVMMGRYPHFKSRPSAIDIEIVQEVMVLCGVDVFADRVFMSLSGGEQQRVQLARSLAQVWDNPNSLLLLDEPISALDMHYQQKVLAIAKALAKRGFIVVLVVHDVNFAATYADRIIMLKHGRKLFDGTPIEVLNTNNIYTVFSVEAAVEINPRTLRPYVRLEEMSLDAYAVNSKLPGEQVEELTLKQKRERILSKDPYLEGRELAKVMGICDAALLLLEKGRYLKKFDFQNKDLFSQITEMGKVNVFTLNSTCLQKQAKKYDFRYKTDDVSEVDLVVSPDEWRSAFLVEEEGNEGIHFFDKSGNLVHGVQLIEGVSNKDVFQRVANQLSPAKEDQLQFDTSLHEGKIGTTQASCKELDMDTVKRMLSRCASHRLDLKITTVNDSSKQCYHGKISNLIDQGNRYIIKEESFELELRLPMISKMLLEERNCGQDEEISISFFDDQEKLVLEFEKGVGICLKEWRDLLAAQVII